MLEDDWEFMLDLIREEPTTLATLQNACHDVNGRWYSLQTICWGLDEFEFSFKCITLVDEHSETQEILARRVAFRQGTLQRGSVSTSKLCLTWMRLVSASPCAARMDTHLNTTTTQFEQQNNTLPLDMHLIVLF